LFRKALEIAKEEAAREAIQEALYSGTRGTKARETKTQYSPRNMRNPLRGYIKKILTKMGFVAKY